MKYKVGDKVRIKSIDWYNMHCDDAGNVDCGCEIFEKEMKPYLGKVFTIHRIVDNSKYEMEEAFGFFLFTDEMIEGLVEDECPQDFIEKYCKSCGTQRCDRTKEFLDGCPHYNAYMCKKQNNAMEEKCDYVQVDNIPDVIQTKTASACSHNGFYGYSDSEGNETSEWYLPDGYQFVDENGNVINATKIVLEKKKPKYPKTYEECCRVLGISDGEFMFSGLSDDEYDLFDSFVVIKRCRDAYWQIAGEEMGLGKPWEPDYTNTGEKKFSIWVDFGEIKLGGAFTTTQMVLSFPTAEMRDAFYENFKKEIESCKELL